MSASQPATWTSAPERVQSLELQARCPGALAAIPASDWDALTGAGSVPLRHGFLRAWETSELAALRSCPVVAYDRTSARPVAASPGYFYDLDIPTVRRPRSAGVMQRLRRLWPRLLLARTYELGSPTPLTNPFVVADRGLRPFAVPALIERGLEEARRVGAVFVFVQNFTSRSGPAAEELARRGFACVSVPTTAVVELPYDSFDAYLAAMRASYRRRAHQTLKRSDSLRAEHLTSFAGIADELARLWRAIYDRATEVQREILTPAFFAGVSALPESSVLLTRRPDDSIASFALLLSDRPWLSFIQCGFEYRAGRDEGAYFRLLYEIIRHAIDDGYDQVDLGITTLTPKLDVGAVPVPLFAWIKHRHPMFQRAIRALADGPLRSEAVERRNVFKDPPPSPEEIVRRRGLLV